MTWTRDKHGDYRAEGFEIKWHYVGCAGTAKCWRLYAKGRNSTLHYTLKAAKEAAERIHESQGS